MHKSEPASCPCSSANRDVMGHRPPAHRTLQTAPPTRPRRLRHGLHPHSAGSHRRARPRRRPLRPSRSHHRSRHARRSALHRLRSLAAGSRGAAERRADEHLADLTGRRLDHFHPWSQGPAQSAQGSGVEDCSAERWFHAFGALGEGDVGVGLRLRQPPCCGRECWSLDRRACCR